MKCPFCIDHPEDVDVTGSDDKVVENLSKIKKRANGEKITPPVNTRRLAMLAWSSIQTCWGELPASELSKPRPFLTCMR
jgi:hypothetical protein